MDPLHHIKEHFPIDTILAISGQDENWSEKCSPLPWEVSVKKVLVNRMRVRTLEV